ncbi:MAG: hypothetical protein FWE32_03725 [Oscillospiraceae bacterium]|nr:hypothetical protein [Oscillospiraceae bacterium]
MPIYVNVIIFLLVCGIVSCLIAMFVLISRGEKKLNVRRLPPIEACPLLGEKHIELQEDLSAISEKLGLQTYVKISVGDFVEARDLGIRQKWRDALAQYKIDFAICDPRTNKILLAVFPVEPDKPPEASQEIVIKALDQVEIPHLQLGNYNRGGLEKALKERLGSALPEPPPKKKGKSPPSQNAGEQPEAAQPVAQAAAPPPTPEAATAEG